MSSGRSTRCNWRSRKISGAASSSAPGQLDRKGGPDTDNTLHQKLSLVAFDDLIGDAEPQAGPRTYVLGCEEPVENSGHDVQRDTLAGVTDRGIHEGGVMPTPQHNLSRRDDGLSGIDQQIQEDLVQLAGVAKNLRPWFVLSPDGGDFFQFAAPDGQGVLQARVQRHNFILLHITLQILDDPCDPLRGSWEAC